MAGKAIEAGILLNGEKEFKSAVTSVNKSLTSMKAEMNKVSAECDGQANTLESLTKKQEILNRVLDEQKKKVAVTENGLKNAKESYENVGKGLEKLWIDVEKATDKMRDLETIYGSASIEAKKQQRIVDELTVAIEKGEKNYIKAGDKVKEWEAKLNTAEAQVIRANREVNKNAAYLKEAENATDQCANSIDAFGKEIKKVSAETNTFGDALKANLAAAAIEKGVGILKEAGSQALSGALDMQKAANQVQASTGLTGDALEQYKDVLEDVYANNYGDNLEDVSQSISKITHNMGELDNATLQNVTESAITLRDTFDMDLDETLRGAKTLMYQFGMTADDAFDLLGSGAQAGLNYTDELGDNISEYGGNFAQAGYSAKEYFQLLKNGTENGAYNLDKVNDAINEVTNKLADGAVEGSLSIYSIGTQNLFKQWQNGAATQKQVIDSIVADINNCTNQQDALTMAATAFGTMGEDSNLKFIQSLTSVGDNFTDVQGKMEEIKNVKYDDLNSQIAEIGRTIQMKLGDQLQKLLPAVSSGLEFVADNLDLVTAAGLGLGAAVGLNAIFKSGFFNAAIRGIQALTTATEGATVAQKLLNAVTAASPLGLVALGVGAVTAAVVGYTLATKDAGDATDDFTEKLEKEAEARAATNDSIQQSLSSSQEKISSLEAEYGASMNLADEIFRLAEQEENSAGKKELMLSMIDQLNQSIPNLNLAYDEQTQKLNMTEGAVRNFIDALEQQAKAQADRESLVGLSKQAWEAEQNIRRAEEEANNLKNLLDSVEAKQEKDWTFDQAIYIKELKTQYEAADGELKEYQKTQAEVEEEYNLLKERIEENVDGLKEQQEQVEASTQANAESAASVEAQKNALSDLQEKYEETRESIQQGLENKISVFDVFSGGEDQTVEEMDKNLESHLEGIRNYKNNLEIIKNEVGKTIAPEFLQYIENMGTDGANMLKHMVATLDQDNGEELLKGFSDKYVAALDGTEGIAKAGAANKMALDMELGKLGSSEVDFSNLHDSIDAAIKGAGKKWSGLSEETKAALNQAVEAAKQSGAKIPDGLAQGIESGEISPKEAIEQLNGSMKAQFQFLEGIAKDAGVTIPQDLRDGIAAGGSEAAEAIKSLAALFGDAGVEMEQKAGEAGANSGQKLADETAKKSGAVEDATQKVVQAAGNAANGSAKVYMNNGYNLITAMAQGVFNGKENVASAVRTAASTAASAGNTYYSAYENMGAYLMSGAVAGMVRNSSKLSEVARQAVANALAAGQKEGEVNSPSRKWRDQLGKHLAGGLAQGIKDGQKDVITQSVELARAALKGAQDELEIRSPSGVFKKKVGRQIGKGVAFGIKDSTKAAQDEAKALSSKILKASTSWMERYKKANKSRRKDTLQNLENEKYYWEQVRKYLKKGTDAYNAATKKISAAKKKISEKEKAIKQKEIAEEKKDYGVSGSGLDMYKTYYNVSAKAEKDYWDTVRKSKGLSAAQKLEADKNYYDAVENLNDQLKNLNQDYEDNVKETNESMIESINEVTEAYADAVAERKESILSSFGLFDEFYSESESGEKLLYNLRSQVAGIADWEKELEELQSRGNLSDAVMDELKEMGPAASASIHALNSLTDEQLKEYNSLYAKRDELAASQAAKDTERQRAESEAKIQQIKANAQKELDAYKAEYDKAYAELTKSMEAPLKQLAQKATTLGETATLNLVRGFGSKASQKSTKEEVKKGAEKITDGFKGLPKEGKKIGKNTLQGILDGLMDGKKIKGGAKDFIQDLTQAIKKEAGIRSPSRLFKQEVGVQISAGVGEGIADGTPKAAKAGTDMIAAMLEQSKQRVAQQQAALSEYAASLNTGASIATFNHLIETPTVQPPVVNMDNTGLLKAFGQMISMMEEYFPQMANQQIVMDTGKVVGETYSAMSESLAMGVRRLRK